jgi:hypothetical protein
MRFWLRIAIVVSALGAGSIVGAQGFNVDVDLFNSDPDVGGGAPSSFFGAAAGQVGFWNALPTGFSGGFPLRDLSGAASSVSVSTIVGWGGGGGWNNPINTGDFSLLLNDGESISGTLQYTITGLAAGAYRVFTYTPRPNGLPSAVNVTVPGSTSQNPQLVSGTMPGNTFIYLRTHSIHDVFITNGMLQIQAQAAPNNFVTGFQIVPVPEPATIAGVILPLGYLLRRRRGG